VLFLDAKGTIPSTSTVTVGSGSELCAGGGNKTVTDLVLEKDAILGFGTSSSTPYTLTVTGSLALPTYAKIALYDSNAPVTTAVTAPGTYAVLQVPAEYAAALATVRWSCATASAGNTYTFSVATEGDTATLSMTIAAKPAAGTDFTVAAGEKCALGSTSVGSETITVNGNLLIDGNLTGTGDGGKVIVGNGGVLDVTGSIKPQSTGATFDFYLNAGGSLFVRNLQSTESYDTDHPLRFNGGTIYPVATTTPSTTVTYPARYSSVLVSDGGVTYDLSHWLDDGRGEEGWYRFNLTAPFDHDPSGAATDGGITVRGTPGETVLLNFGAGFVGSTMNGGIMVEEGGNIVIGSANALANQSVTLLPSSHLRQYGSTTYAPVDSLTLGRADATAPVQFQVVANQNNPAFIVNSLSVLSPVEVSFISNWRYDAYVSSCTNVMAAVFKAGSSSVDTSFFQLPASATNYTLSAETVALTEGNYAGYTALYITVTGEDIGSNDLELKTDGTNVTLSADAAYDYIYVGDIEGTGSKSLTVTGGEISAQYLHIASYPVDGSDSSDRHTITYTQSGGKVSVGYMASMWRGENAARGRVDAEITLNGGVLDVADYVRFGFNRTRAGYTAKLTINDGAAMTVGGTMWLTYYSGSEENYCAPQGIINMNGGTLSVGNDIDLSRGLNESGYKKDGGIFLKGGIISARNIRQSSADCTAQRLVFDGGVYAPNAAATNQTLTGLAKAHVAAGGAIVDTSALAPGGAYTIAQNLLTDPALNGAADGGFTKCGTGTLALTGANTFTGPTRVEGGILAITSGEAVSGDIDVSDSAALDLGGASVSVGKIAASGLVRNGSLTVTGAIAAADAESMLAVDGDLTLAPRSAIDFGGCAAVPTGWTPVAVASGTVTVPGSLRARNAGEFNRCETQLIDGVLYVKLSTSGTVISFR
jgi:autotransporter-associated beta strand protein